MEVNFNVIKKLGADCAIYLQYLVKNSGQSVQTSMDKVSKQVWTKCPNWKSGNLTQNSTDYQYFSKSRNEISLDTGFCQKKQQRMLKKLVGFGVVQTVRISCPARLLYILNISEITKVFECDLVSKTDVLEVSKEKKKRKEPKEKKKRKNKIKLLIGKNKNVFDNSKLNLLKFYDLWEKDSKEDIKSLIINDYKVDPKKVMGKFSEFNKDKVHTFDSWCYHLDTFLTHSTDLYEKPLPTSSDSKKQVIPQWVIDKRNALCDSLGLPRR